MGLGFSDFVLSNIGLGFSDSVRSNIGLCQPLVTSVTKFEEYSSD